MPNPLKGQKGMDFDYEKKNNEIKECQWKKEDNIIPAQFTWLDLVKRGPQQFHSNSQKQIAGTVARVLAKETQQDAPSQAMTHTKREKHT